MFRFPSPSPFSFSPSPTAILRDSSCLARWMTPAAVSDWLKEDITLPSTTGAIWNWLGIFSPKVRGGFRHWRTTIKGTASRERYKRTTKWPKPEIKICRTTLYPRTSKSHGTTVRTQKQVPIAPFQPAWTFPAAVTNVPTSTICTTRNCLLKILKHRVSATPALSRISDLPYPVLPILHR